MNAMKLPQGFDFQGAIPLWRVDESGQKISREFVFEDFEQAFAFMTLSAQYAEKINHHPDWSNSWNRVMVELSTHSAKALTQLDVQMAQAMDQFACNIQSKD